MVVWAEWHHSDMVGEIVQVLNSVIFALLHVICDVNARST